MFDNDESSRIGWNPNEQADAQVDGQSNHDSSHHGRKFSEQNLILHTIDHTNDTHLHHNNHQRFLVGNANDNSSHIHESLTVSSVISSEASTEVVDNRTVVVNSIEASTRINKPASSSTTQQNMSKIVELNPLTVPLTKVLSISHRPLPQIPLSPPKLTRSTLVTQQSLRSRPLEDTDRSLSTVAVVEEEFSGDAVNQLRTPTRLSNQTAKSRSMDKSNDTDVANEEHGPVLDFDAAMHQILVEKVVKKSSSYNECENTTSTLAFLDVSIDDQSDVAEGENREGHGSEANGAYIVDGEKSGGLLQRPVACSISNSREEYGMICTNAAKASHLSNYSDDYYEEEATPDQTAFGKELLFRRVLRRSNSSESNEGSDVLSTASEMGTVIGTDGGGDERLEELNEVLLAMSDNDNVENNIRDNRDNDQVVQGSPASVTSELVGNDPDGILGLPNELKSSSQLLQQLSPELPSLGPDINAAQVVQPVPNLRHHVDLMPCGPPVDSLSPIVSHKNLQVRSDTVKDKDNAGLSIPVLEGLQTWDGAVDVEKKSVEFHDSSFALRIEDIAENCLPTPPGIIAQINNGKSLYHRSRALDDEQAHYTRDYIPIVRVESQVVDHVSATPSSSILSMAMRTLGSNFTGQPSNSFNRRSAHYGNAESISAPTTPRAFVSPTALHGESPGIGPLSGQFPFYSPRGNGNFEEVTSVSQKQKYEQHSFGCQMIQTNGEEGVISFEADKKTTQWPPTSFLLRSPGSFAHVAAHSSAKKNTKSKNLEASRNQQKIVQVGTTNGDDEDAGIFGTGHINLPLRIARSCFSFDDTTIVDDPAEWTYHATAQESCGTQFHLNSQRNHRTMGTVTPAHFVPVSHTNYYSKSTNERHLLINNSSLNSVNDSPILQSISWDVGGSSQHLQADSSKPRLSPFRRRSSRLPFRDNVNVLGPSISRHEKRLVQTPTRGRSARADRGLNSDFSPIFESSNDVDALPLMTPQRIEIEREDALDILSCLVERGVSWKQEFDYHPSVNSNTDEIKTGSKTNPTDDKESKSSDFRSQTPSVSDIVAVVRELEELSLADERMDCFHNNSAAHQRRKEALSELLKSHQYALEMKRASQSASHWLSSIGRRPSPFSQSNENGNQKGQTQNSIDATASVGSTSKESAMTSGDRQPAGESASEDIDLLTAKAMLHSAQLEANEKSDLADRLNEELAKCRAEIGRLKTASQKASVIFRSPNRSILDASDDISVTEVEDEDERDRSFENASPIPPDVNDSGFLDTSFPETGDDVICNDLEAFQTTNTNLVAYQDDSRILRLALDEANSKIKELEGELFIKRHQAGTQTTPIISCHVDVKNVDRKTSSLQGNTRTSNDWPTTNGQNRENLSISNDDVDITDMENFATDWTELASPLPNPPSHGIRSPLVYAVLEQWTADKALHQALLTWMDQALEGNEVDLIPPLTLSSLDHQVRDGFLLHVLPILLRRPGIRVDVKSRAHRRTVYDIAVAVESIPSANTNKNFIHQKSDKHFSVDRSARLRHLETTSASSDVGMSSSVTHSSATTAIIANKKSVPVRHRFAAENLQEIGTISTKQEGTLSSRMSYDEMAEDMTVGFDEQPGLFSALGGAFSGLLTRRKSPTSSSGQSIIEASAQAIATPLQTVLESPVPWTSPPSLVDNCDANAIHSGEHNNTQPYHRVVSAPSGRIGVTFVEYRGHCMVSDVADDSPLIGWIFQSDVLIAIDEIPVSGMRVRDIIRILKDRKNRSQRALRVISGRAMNEINPHTSMIMDSIS